MINSPFTSNVINLLPAGMNDITLQFEGIETTLSSVICDNKILAPLFVLQIACIFHRKQAKGLFDFNIKCNSDSPTGLELVDLNYSTLDEIQQLTLLMAAKEAFWDLFKYVLGGDSSCEEMSDRLAAAVTYTKQYASYFSGDILSTPALPKVMGDVFKEYSINKYTEMAFAFSLHISVSSTQSVEESVKSFDDKIDDLIGFDDDEDNASQSLELQPANQSDIFKCADKAVRALIDRIGLYAKALGKKVDDALLIAAIGACKPARDAIKAALELTEAQHLQLPASVHCIYESLYSRVEMRALEGDNQFQTDWFSLHQVPANKSLFDEVSLTHFSWLFVKSNGVIKFSVPHIKYLFNMINKNDNALFADLVSLNTRSSGSRARLIRSIEDDVNSSIIGQNEACTAAVNSIRKILTPGPSARGPLFFYGASGVGKTFLATTLACSIARHGLLYDLQIFNMETFGQERSESQLIGSGSQFANAIIGELTMPMEFNPNQIFVFDEIEKAHTNVLRSLLTILSARTCVDATTRREVDFSQAIFIFTSNVGQSAMHSTTNQELSIDHTSALSEVFSPEFISRMRLGEIVCCKPLSPKHLIEYIEKNINTEIQQKYECSEGLTRAVALLSEGLSPRSLAGSKAKIGALVAMEIENALIDSGLDESDNISLQFSFKPGQHMDISVIDFISQYHYRTWRTDVSSTYEVSGQDITITLVVDAPRSSIATEHLSLPFMRVSLSTDVRFSDVFGHHDVKAELASAIENIKQFKHQDGIMLYGAPGTGKTMMARALAGEAGVTFISVNAPDLTSGDTETNIKKLFEAAKRYSPSIVFIDEFDAIAGKRETGSAGIRLMVSSLLTMLDGFHGSNLGLLTIVASNHPDHIDAAILRPGRISNHLHLEAPDTSDIETLLNTYSLSEQINKHTTRLATRLLSGRNIVKTKQLLNRLQSQTEIDDSAVRLAIIDEVFGPAENDKFASSKELIAYHEAGHAIVSKLLVNESVLLLDIQKRGKRAGFCMPSDESGESRLLNRIDIENKVKVCLAGRAAEWLFTGDDNLVSIGASEDLSMATKMLKSAILNHGMSRSGALAVGKEFNQSEHNTFAEVNAWLGELYDHTKQLVSENKHDLLLIANALLKSGTLFEDDLAGLLPPHRKHTQAVPLLQCSNDWLN